MTVSTLAYTPLSDRAQKVVDNFIPPDGLIEERTQRFAHVKPREPNKEGGVEVLHGVTFTHHFVHGPGEGGEEEVLWHYVEAGPRDAEAIVFLHGIPDSWFQWNNQMTALAATHHCIAPDLKGYGQSEKRPGIYTHEGASEQLFSMLEKINITRFNLVTHDRGTVQGDYITANHPDNVIRYCRGEQHLYHFNPLVAPQGDLFAEAPYSGMMADPVKFVLWVYTWVGGKEVSDEETIRTIQEHSYPGISKAVPRYFNSSSFRAEWLERRRRLLKAWKCPVQIMQGYHSKSQPREFYENAREYIPNAPKVEVVYLTGGHFWTLECPEETTEAIKKMLRL
ncbi:hypothetical protein QWA68_015690 [Fusarium oxysporum]|nr:hypothetical protein QWA68_015690 [Fusarium oxysporum]